MLPFVLKNLICSGVFILAGLSAYAVSGFAPDETPVPRSQPALAPVDGATVLVNPPSIAWKSDARASRYVLELAPTADFSRDVVRAPDIPYAYYNHNAVLAPGKWYWRYSIITADGQVSLPSTTKTFTVGAETPPLPLPNARDLIAALPGHPRIFTTPETLAAFRARREGPGRMAWEQVRLQAEEALKKELVKPALLPLADKLPTHRRQIFWVEQGMIRVPKDYGVLDLVRDADRANLLSYAYLISGEERYALAAKSWALFAANFRVDYHMKTVAERGQRETVVYAYERGLKGIALVYDRLQEYLSPEERKVLIEHIEFHGEAAMHWIRDVLHLHRDYQESHGQQCMHMLLTTALAIAGDSAKSTEWLTYMIPQYANRIPWMSEDGGYFEGQAYAFKLSFILEALAALRTATGVDLFQKPEIRNAGDFFLYCQSMNYWWPHWGDTMGLWFPFGNVGDGFMSALLAAMTDNRPLQWFSNNVAAASATPPFGYLAATGLAAQPPVAIAQARAFVPTGVFAAFDRHYDQNTTRLFFRSSPWGGESHAHADQNSFVLHSGGEILAADTGYYTYFGDENYNRVATQTLSHNSVLVDGRGQTNDIKGAGKITGFFNSPRYAFVGGDASTAYGTAMQLFRRDMLYLRPGLVVIADELSASQPAEFTWLFNAFVEPEINATKREFTVIERGEELRVRHLFPEHLRYEASNEKIAPRKTREWTRFTEAFPEPWRLRAISDRAAQADFLTLLDSFRKADGQKIKTVAATRDEHSSALKLTIGDDTATIVMRRRIAERGEYSTLGLRTDARAAVVEYGPGHELKRWVAVEAASLAVAEGSVFSGSSPMSVAYESTPLGRALVTATAQQATEVSLGLAQKPAGLALARPAALEKAQPLAMRWERGVLTFTVPSGESAVIIEPNTSLTTRPPGLEVAIRAGNDVRKIAFETAAADNGDWIAYATLVSPASGVYEIRSSMPEAEILVQDRWDPERSQRGRGFLRALVSDGTEVILRFAPAGNLPEFTATRVEAVPLSQINLVRNGDCEAGLPGFPPRGWTVQNGCSSETYGVAGEQGWPGWTQEDAASGQGALKFIRPINHTVDWRPPNPVLARNQMVALAPPVRLMQGGKFVLSCKTKGTATTASVEIESAAGVVKTIAITPSETWESRRIEVDLPAGYTLIRVKFSEGGRDDQLLWADDFFLAPVELP